MSENISIFYYIMVNIKLYKEVFDNLLEGVQIISNDFSYLYVNKTVCEHARKTQDELIGNKMTDIYPGIENTPMFSCLKKSMSERTPSKMTNEFEYPDGKKGWFQLSFEPVNDGILIMSIDITERNNLEQQLFQSQKLEAVGRLAGGVAHDFNNILSVIMGYCDLIFNHIGCDNQLTEKVEQIYKCSERASKLTGQLLAFSRKQVMEPQIINLNQVVINLESMLHRLIGEDIRLSVITTQGLPNIKADPGQLEQVIVNLVVNARDAMPDGGCLTIETSEIELDESYAGKHISSVPGKHVMLAVTDTGSGMDDETKEHIFEPFFTTKEKGKGTGLGLSTVYGIIKQSGGTIWCYSELNKGTSFKIYLPVSAQSPVESAPKTDNHDIRTGSETILLAEDDDSIRKISQEMLKIAGYNVITAANGEEALLVSDKYTDKIDLLITDVVMTGISGKQLSEKLLLAIPDLKILYTSGYTDNVIIKHGVLEKRVPFLQKPYNMALLTKKVREVLDT